MTLDQAALEYVITHGNPLERWRAGRLLGLAGPLPPGWDSRQNPDGGWQSRETTSPLSNTGFTSMMLMRMAFAGLTDTPQWQRTVEYFRRTQQPDGRWTENRGQLEAGLPEWNQPGDLETELWETANTAAVLGACGYAGDPLVARALDFVRGHGRDDGTFPGYLHATYAMAAAMHTRGAAVERDRYLQAAGRFLDQYGQAEWFDIMDVTWALILWATAGIPREDSTVQRYIAELAPRRSSSGTWPTRYPGCEPGYTLEALELLRRYGRINGGTSR